MKMVTIILQPEKVNEVKNALSQVGVQGMSMTKIRGFGKQKGQTEFYRGSKDDIDFLAKIKLETVVDEKILDATISAAVKAAKTGKQGDGKIFVQNVEEVVRIRTNETGKNAL